jgi:methyl-accepting chemotaxis protein
VGQTANAFNELQSRIRDVLRSVRLSADAVAVASREIASGNVDLSARTEEQAASLEETASSMTQLTQTVRQNADNARQANVLAGNATELADSGDASVIAMVDTIRKITESSDKISDITGVIEGIAFQTNILALNAAVEAARAGEQGRGFAVVASEVRSLAQRSSTAAKEIKGLIEVSAATVRGGATQVTEVGATMGKVKQAIKQVSDIVGEIAAASEEQSTGIEQISRAVSQMDEVTQQNAALVEQAAAAAQSLEEQAGALNDSVGQFKLGEGGRMPNHTAPSASLGPRKSIAAKAVSHPPVAREIVSTPRVIAKSNSRQGVTSVDSEPAGEWQTF